MPQPRLPIVAAIVGRDGFALNDGTTSSTPPDWWDNPGQMMTALGATCALDATVLWDMKEWPNCADELQLAGWIFKGFRNDYTTFHRIDPAGSLQAITIGLLPNIDGGNLFDAKTDPWPVIVQRLAKYKQFAGVSWRGMPGINGIQMLRNLYQDKRPGYQPRWFLSKGPGSPDWRGGKMWPAGDLMWRREPNAVETRTEPRVVRLDMNGQYLAAAMNAHYAWGELEHSDTELFDGKRAGYWLIRHEDITGCWPSPLPALIGSKRIREDGSVWLTTPMMGLLAERGCHPNVIESWTAPGRRFLVSWAEHYRNARLSLGMLEDKADPHVRQALKETPNKAIGLFNRRGGRLYRPDWQHTTIDTARANMLRKLVAVFESCGEIPLRVDYDSVWYCEGPAIPALKAADALHGVRIGKFRHINTSAFVERDWEGKK